MMYYPMYYYQEEVILLVEILDIGAFSCSSHFLGVWLDSMSLDIRFNIGYFVSIDHMLIGFIYSTTVNRAYACSALSSSLSNF